MLRAKFRLTVQLETTIPFPQALCLTEYVRWLQHIRGPKSCAVFKIYIYRKSWFHITTNYHTKHENYFVIRLQRRPLQCSSTCSRHDDEWWPLTGYFLLPPPPSSWRTRTTSCISVYIFVMFILLYSFTYEFMQLRKFPKCFLVSL